MSSAQSELFHIHNFTIPGQAYILLVGKNIPIVSCQMCFVHGLDNPIISTSSIAELILKEVIQVYRS
jgi:hypothetical protein